MDGARNYNLASHGSDHVSEVLFANFNQDCSSLAIAMKRGYRLYSLNSVENLEMIYDNEGETTDVCLVDRLFSSSLVAVVSLNSPRKLKVCHFKKGTEICNYSYSNTILAVKLNRLRLVVVLEESIYIHSIRDMKVLHTIRDTPTNSKGLCCLSSNNDNSYFAYPGSNVTGEVQIFDVTTLKGLSTISAHDSALAAMAFDSTATKLATASGRGTVIRVFAVRSGQKLFEFRRGVKRCVSIGSLAFSPDSKFLCASSNTETIHIFKLEEQVGAGSNQAPVDGSGVSNTWGDFFRGVTSYLPSQVSDVLSQGRDFATVKLPFSNARNVCAITLLQKLPHVVIVDEKGFLYIYTLNVMEGGECPLLRQHMLTETKAPQQRHKEQQQPLPSSSSSLNNEAPPRFHLVTTEKTDDVQAIDEG